MSWKSKLTGDSIIRIGDKVRVKPGKREWLRGCVGDCVDRTYEVTKDMNLIGYGHGQPWRMTSGFLKENFYKL